MKYSGLNPMKYRAVLKEAYRRGFRVINGQDLKDRIEELDNDTDNCEPCFIIIGNVIVDLEMAWDEDGYIDTLDY